MYFKVFVMCVLMVVFVGSEIIADSYHSICEPDTVYEFNGQLYVKYKPPKTINEAYGDSITFIFTETIPVYHDITDGDGYTFDIAAPE